MARSRRPTVNSRQSPDSETSDAPYELPDGWTWTTIGDACSVNPAMKFPEQLSEDSPVHFVPMAAVDDVTGAITAPQPRPIGEVWKGYKRFQDGDVIFARITPCMENGKAAIAKNLLNRIGLGSTEFHVLRPSDNVLAEWVYHFVRQQSFRNEAARAMTGTAGQLRVPADFVVQAAVPLPPLPEQRRIVAKIKSLFAESRTAHDGLERVPALIKRFRQSVLAAAFRGELTERDPIDEPASTLLARLGKSDTNQIETHDLPKLPEGWAWVRFEELLTELKNGHFSKAPAFEPPGIPILRVSSVRSRLVDLNDRRYLREKLDKVANYQLRDGDLLFTRYNGSLDLVGVCGMVRGLKEPILHPDKLIRARVTEGISPEYLELYFATRVPRNIIEDKAKSSAGQTGISGQDLRRVPVALAPLAEQRRIVTKIEALFAQADAIERAVAIARQRADKIDQAILARAFRGEL